MRPAARPDQHCEFCTAEKRATRLEHVTLLPGEAWGGDGMAHALQISGRTQLGYMERFVFDVDHHKLNNPCSAWFSDRLQQVATEHLQCLPSPYSVRGAPFICRHHKACYEQSEVGAAVSKLESELKHIEHRFIGSTTGRRKMGAAFTVLGEAAPRDVPPEGTSLERYRLHMQCAYTAIRQVYCFRKMTWGEYELSFRAALVAALEEASAAASCIPNCFLKNRLSISISVKSRRLR